ncbi:hypothetical protein Tco_1011832, partial [Tanacetum coccineum]
MAFTRQTRPLHVDCGILDSLVFDGDHNKSCYMDPYILGDELRKEHQAKLSLIDNKVDQGIATSHDLNDRVSSLKILNDIDKKEASDVAQKAKVKCGDWIEEPGEVKAEFYDHFSNRFAYTGGSRPCIGDLSFKCLSPEQKDSLERDLSNEEIKRAVWDCGEERAPGPDG